MKKHPNYQVSSENKISKITSAKAVELLAQDGIVISEEQAKIILEFMYEMAEVVVDQYLNNIKEKNGEINSII